MGILLGLLSAVTASALFSAGLVLQAVEARMVPSEHTLRWSLIVRLARRRRWLLGGILMVVGFGFHVAALTAAPLTVVQPALAAGLLVLLVVGARAGAERIGARELSGVLAIVAGVACLTFTAPGRAAADPGSAPLALSLGTLGLIAAVPHALALARLRRGDSSDLLTTLGAGAGYALTAFTTKLLSDAIALGRLDEAILWLALTALVGALVLVDQTSSLQRRGAVEVGPIVFLVPVVIPVLLAPVLVGEGWSEAPLGSAPLAASLVAVCAGAAALAGSPPVVAAGEGRAAPPAREPRTS